MILDDGGTFDIFSDESEFGCVFFSADRGVTGSVDEGYFELISDGNQLDVYYFPSDEGILEFSVSRVRAGEVIIFGDRAYTDVRNLQLRWSPSLSSDDMYVSYDSATFTQ